MEYVAEHIRYINFGLLVVALILMIASSIVRREKMIRRVRRVWFWFFLSYCNSLYATGANISDHIRLNPPAYINTVILIGLIGAFLYNPGDDNKLPPDDHSLSTRFVNWLDGRVRQHKANR